jgi:NAD(P)-dependent dehydrogenase (short-subunit alcohol dehydrogenase family)
VSGQPRSQPVPAASGDQAAGAKGTPTAIVVGAGSGIGAATARAFARAGYNVGITYRANEDGAERVAAEVRREGVYAIVKQLDVTEHDPFPIFADVGSRLGGLDVLVCCAGERRHARSFDETSDDFTKVLRTNLVGPWACAVAAARSMVAARGGGRIVLVSSVLGAAPASGAVSYCASKAGLEAVTRTLALELAPLRVAVNAVAPGRIATPMAGFAEEPGGGLVRPVIPLGRIAKPAEVAAAILFLSRPEASYVTGSVLTVDGGLMLVSGPEILDGAIKALPG